MSEIRMSAEKVRALAELAKLELDAGEVERMRRELDAILAYVEQIESLPTEGVPPTTHPLELATPLRADAVAGVLSVEAALAAAPERAGGALVVPKVIE
jgi:aspartyl-tRNA(Asn)/glutamyl-tRNA(Gln) amidotransferase subunit C